MNGDTMNDWNITWFKHSGERISEIDKLFGVYFLYPSNIYVQTLSNEIILKEYRFLK